MKVTRIISRNDDGRMEVIVELEGTMYEAVAFSPGEPADIVAERFRWLAMRLEYRARWTPEQVAAVKRAPS